MEIRRNRLLLKVASFRPPSTGLPRFFHLFKANATNKEQNMKVFENTSPKSIGNLAVLLGEYTFFAKI